MRVLLTGASGFIGDPCIRTLVEHGHDVVAVTRAAPRVQMDGVDWVATDLLRLGAASALLERHPVDAVIHLAWCTEPGTYWTATENLEWVRASLDLARAFVATGGRRFVGAGTCAEYAWGTRVLEEGLTPLEPQTLYGVSKNATRAILDAYFREADVAFAWGRVFFGFGPGEAMGRLVPYVINRLLAGEPADCTSGEQVRDFLPVDAIADAFVAILQSPVEGPINIGSGQPLRVRDLVTTLGELLGHPELVRLGAVPDRPDEPDSIVAATTRLRDEVGFIPTESLPSALLRTIDWWQAARLHAGMVP